MDVFLFLLIIQTDIIGTNVKIGVHQSILPYNLNYYKNKQMCNKDQIQKLKHTKRMDNNYHIPDSVFNL